MLQFCIPHPVCAQRRTFNFYCVAQPVKRHDLQKHTCTFEHPLDKWMLWRAEVHPPLPKSSGWYELLFSPLTRPAALLLIQKALPSSPTFISLLSSPMFFSEVDNCSPSKMSASEILAENLAPIKSRPSEQRELSTWSMTADRYKP